ncbi:efflux RND transporter periplasmic adaptor subunit [Halomonas sabkhae]|uniref:efflux RND transporter periplasmic adaptor subunit n=1 Tax=Halomonas sabkhae TaxID=626223 RepID=UPI0025B58DA5|nr:efflux RND transporter periplasmic adaptor subunit [Halomonas sabkhae]MDN3524487.1 efflux RND transporter periplasmic adaptor subunit [Halomonas sabkhae]
MPPVPRPARLLPMLFGPLALALTLTACSPEDTADTAVPRVVDSYRIPDGNGDSAIHLAGRVEAAEHTTLSFEVSGKLEQLELDVGDTFQAGDVLARLNDARYRLVARQRRAEAKEAKASLTESRQDFRRQSRLAERNYASDTRLDSARAALDTAESRHESALAALQIAERDLEQTTLEAPFEGTVSARRAEPAERVSANQAIVDVISDRDGFEVTTSVPETLIGHLEAGTTQRVSLPALGGTTLPARLTHLGSQPRSSNDYPVILALDDPPPSVRAGMTAEVRLTPTTEAADTDSLSIPLTALIHDDDHSAHVLRIADDSKLVRVAVEVVELNGEQARVRGDLAPGQRIVARGAEFVEPGQVVSLLGQGPERYN